MSATLTEYQRENLDLWSRTQMVEFLMKEGLRGPRRSLRSKPTEWLMQGCIEEGALQCSECLDETTAQNPLMDTGLCENCQQTTEENDDDCDHCSQHCP